MVKNTAHSDVVISKRLGEVNVGEFAQSYDPDKNEVVFSEVYFISHDGENQNSTKLRKLVLDSDYSKEISIRLHPSHLVYACLSNTDNMCNRIPSSPVTAQKVTVGDILWTRNYSSNHFSPKRVIGVSTIQSSVRHPMTMNHLIVVDDVLASVHMYDEQLYRKATSLIRFAYNLHPAITDTWVVKKMVESWDLLEKYYLRDANDQSM